MHLSIANGWNNCLYELIALSCLNANHFSTAKYKFYIFGLCAADRAKLFRGWGVNAVAIYGKAVVDRKDKTVFLLIIIYI